MSLSKSRDVPFSIPVNAIESVGERLKGSRRGGRGAACFLDFHQPMNLFSYLVYLSDVRDFTMYRADCRFG